MPTPEPRYNPDDEDLPLCEDCDQPTTQRNEDGRFVCPTCQAEADMRASEQAYERRMSRYYGGSAPQTDAQRADAAHKAKRWL